MLPINDLIVFGSINALSIILTIITILSNAPIPQKAVMIVSSASMLIIFARLIFTRLYNK